MEKIPVIETVGEAFRLFRKEGHRVLVAGAVAVLVMALKQVIFIKMGLNAAGFDQAKAFYFLPVSVVLSMMALPLITGAHRIVLQGDRGRTEWGFHREEWLYFLSGFRLILPILLAAVVIGIVVGAAGAMVRILGGNGGAAGWVAVPIMISFVIVGFVSCRYLLIFPAAAIGEKIPLRRSRDLLKGNNWRMFVSVVLILFPFGIINLLLKRLGADLWVVSAIMMGVVSAISTILLAFLLSLTYRRLAMSEPSTAALP